MGSILINDIECDVDPQCNLVQAARQAGVEIPHYCWHPDLSVVASCRMCLVEIGERSPDGKVVMSPRLVPACQTKVRAGIVVNTRSEKVRESQRQTLEYLLLNHPLDCSICDQAGECYLQDYSYKYGRAHSRLHEPKIQRKDKSHIGDQITLFTDRCVMCTRCVRFTREFSGTSELMVINRGSHEEIDVFPGNPCNNKLAGNVVDLCPVGALCSKDFLYQKRVWWLTSAESVCTGCSTGCSIHVDQSEQRVYRLRPRENPQAQGSFICDDGRFGWKYIQSKQRLTGPRQGRSEKALASEAALSTFAANGSKPTTNELPLTDPWPPILGAARVAIAGFAKRGSAFLAVLSPFMTCEEAFILSCYLRTIAPQIVLGMGPVPVLGEDDCYPKGPRGEPPTEEHVRFTIRAEKCPNRRGVEAVLQHYQGAVLPFEECCQRLSAGRFSGAYLVGGYPGPWLDANTLDQLRKLELLVVQDILESPLCDAADFVLAAAASTERDGTVINHAGLAQTIRLVTRPPGDAWSDGRILTELAGRRGLFHAPSIRAEIAEQVPALAAFAGGEIGELGRQVL